MNNSRLIIIGVVALLLFIVLGGSCFTVQETEVVILTQFGRTVGPPIVDAGLHFKIPLIQQVNVLDKRVLGWDGPNSEMPTKDKLYIVVDTFARWRIVQPTLFFTSLRDTRSALSRLDDVIGSETRNTVARHALVELIRTTKGRPPIHDEALIAAHGLAPASLPEITSGRVALEDEITKESKRKLAAYGIELLNVRFKRINYNPAVASKIHDRMISERRQIAELFRSEGAGEAAKISGTRERDIRKIESEAYAKTQILQGKADAEAIAIYAQAFNGSAEAREFYAFQRTLETYKTSFTRDTTFVMTTGDGFLQYLKGETLVPKAKAPASAPGPVSQPSPP
ncbi:MAG TPA: protease modulator HflC [Chthoniobacteraceae bacterium]|jgi:membrane protease subunit HflC|nr:protease modulator HflC [Chthoniobacteraceae bacterium]